MLGRQVSFRGRGEEYVLVRRGESPWGLVERFELVDQAWAERLVLREVMDRWQNPDWGLLHCLDIHEHPYNLHPGQLQDAVLHALRSVHAPQLYRCVRARHTLSVPAVSPPRTSVPPAEAVRDPRSWLVVDLVSKAGKPLQGFRLELTLSDGSVRALATDLHGRISVDRIDPGTCSITSPIQDSGRGVRA